MAKEKQAEYGSAVIGKMRETHECMGVPPPERFGIKTNHPVLEK